VPLYVPGLNAVWTLTVTVAGVALLEVVADNQLKAPLCTLVDTLKPTDAPVVEVTVVAWAAGAVPFWLTLKAKDVGEADKAAVVPVVVTLRVTGTCWLPPLVL
jgi:hypothetical protein